MYFLKAKDPEEENNGSHNFLDHMTLARIFVNFVFFVKNTLKFILAHT